MGQDVRMAVSTMPPPRIRPPRHRRPRRRRPRRVLVAIGAVVGLLAVGGIVWLWLPGSAHPSLANEESPAGRTTTTPTPVPFDPNRGAILPDHRIVAFYA